MKIAAINAQRATGKSAKQTKQDNQKNVNFKSGAMLAGVGTLMQGIENKGYFLSFLIQDGLGMTLPRTVTGFNRDKEITGHLNMQEGTEVFLREGLTGPYIIGVAPFVLWITRKFCKSTNTNTRLIKRFGDDLKNMVKESSFNKEIQKDAKKFKEKFYKYSVEKIYKNTIPNDKNSENTIKEILSELEKLDSSNKNTKKAAKAKIVEIFNEKLLENSSELFNINKVSVGEEGTKKYFHTAEAFEALSDYAHDAIINNEKRNMIDANAAENIKNNFATKRLLTNISNIVLTLGGLSVLPKLYARSDVSPGAAALQHAKNKKAQENTQKEQNPTFKGKNINGSNGFSGFGKFLTKKVPEKIQELFEYAGYNFTKSTFACLSLFGLLLPRGKRAWDRAPKDENGKRDMTEINEILLRDTISSLSVVFAVPLLTKLMVNTYENKVGFILTNRASDGKNIFKKALDVINPYSNLDVLSIADLDAIYGNINSKDKLMNFANFVNNKGGDLEKIISQSNNHNLIFNDKTFTLDSIKNLSKKEKNQKILDVFKNLDIKDSKAKNELISKVMQGSGNIKNNKIAQFARGLNSIPGAVSTFLISPILLGIFIPMLTYHNTRKAHEKALNGTTNK